MFKGSASGNYLTIEKSGGHMVPVGVFAITPEDEEELDRYEGYPSFYYKQSFNVRLKKDDGSITEIEAFAYVMHEERALGAPSEEYIERVREGYHAFGFDERLLEEAIEFSTPKHSPKEVREDKEVPLVDRIVKLLKEHQKGLKSGRIAEILGVSKKEINKVLYANKNIFTIDIFFTWKLK